MQLDTPTNTNTSTSSNTNANTSSNASANTNASTNANANASANTSANDTNQSKQASAENQEIGSAGRSTKEQGKATITDVQEGGMVEKRDAMDVSTGNSGGGENTSETQTLEDSNSKMSHGGNKGKSKSYGNKSFQQGDAQGNQNKFKKNQRRKKMDKRERNTIRFLDPSYTPGLTYTPKPIFQETFLMSFSTFWSYTNFNK